MLLVLRVVVGNIFGIMWGLLIVFFIVVFIYVGLVFGRGFFKNLWRDFSFVMFFNLGLNVCILKFFMFMVLWKKFYFLGVDGFFGRGIIFNFWLSLNWGCFMKFIIISVLFLGCSDRLLLLFNNWDVVVFKLCFWSIVILWRVCCL